MVSFQGSRNTVLIGGVLVLVLVAVSAGAVAQGEIGRLPETISYPVMNIACAENPSEGRISSDDIICFGGYSAGDDVDEIVKLDIIKNNPRARDIYESGETSPSTGNTIPTMPSERMAMSCTTDSVDDEVYCLGGYSYPFGGHLDEVLRYDPQTDSITELTGGSETLEYARTKHSCVEDTNDDMIYCFGGYANGSHGVDPDKLDYVLPIERYDADNDQSEFDASNSDIPFGRADLSCAYSSSQDSTYCFGGFNQNGHSDTIFNFSDAGTPGDTSDDEFNVLSQTLPHNRSGMSCSSAQNGLIYCLGGLNSTHASDAILSFDPATGVIGRATTMPEQLFSHACAEDTSSQTRGNNIYCFGGFNGSHHLDSVIDYSYETEGPQITCDNCIEPTSTQVGNDVSIAPAISSRTEAPVTEVVICSSKGCTAQGNGDSIICQSSSPDVECTFTSQTYDETGIWVRATDRLGNSNIKQIGEVSFLLGENAICEEDTECLSGICDSGRCTGTYPPPVLEFTN